MSQSNISTHISGLEKRLGYHPCRSELARDEGPGTEGIQVARVIVGLHRERARSYRVRRTRMDSSIWSMEVTPVRVMW
ncbi:TPA: hypothetical protein SAN82_002652 [Pseudomonas putida]|nr:hypothetical protein [Pseudomonas putida]